MNSASLHPLTNSSPLITPAGKGLLQRKCACGNQAAGGSECAECGKKKLQRQLRAGASNAPLAQQTDNTANQVVFNQNTPAISSFSFGQIQREEKLGEPLKEKTEEEKYKEGGKKLAEAFLETPVGKQLAEDAKKAMFDTWKGRIITGTVAVGTITALAAAEKELPVQLPEIPLDFLTPGFSIKLEYNGPVNKPTDAMLTFKFTEQAPAARPAVNALTADEKYRAETAKIAADQAKFKAGLITPGSPEDLQQKADQEDRNKIAQKYAGHGPDIGAIIKKYPWLATPEPTTGLQLNKPKFGYGFKNPSLLGGKLKLTFPNKEPNEKSDKEPDKKPDEKKKKDEETGLQKKLSIGASNDPLEAEADRVADQVLAKNSGTPETSPAISRVQRHSATTADASEDAPASVNQTLSGSGVPLDKTTRTDMEVRFGHDFSHVRIHQGSIAEKSAQDVNANAYTLGNNIVFGAGQYNPESHTGKRLLAHELTHVLQQSDQTSGLVQRKPEKKAAPISALKTKQPRKKTAGNAPKLTVTDSINGAPCACVVVVHNDESYARKTAELMHANCAYNLALINPDSGDRTIHIPGKKAKVDPNSLFPSDIAESCINDRKGCNEFLVDKANSTKPDEIEKFVQIQYFTSIADCTNGFSLPVVALHNNDTKDTKNFITNKKNAKKKDVENLKLDVDKSTKETGDDRIARLKKMIRDKFGGQTEVGGQTVVKETMETPKKTNIFRWCASKDLSQCHIGDPANPDNVSWVTNKADFDTLKTRNINVALQSELPGEKSESEDDLSTLFLHLPKIIAKNLFADASAVLRALNFLFPKLFMDKKIPPEVEQVLRVLISDMLHYVNIETPGKAISAQSDAERARNYDAIVTVLDLLGLHCCGKDTDKADAAIKKGLELDK